MKQALQRFLKYFSGGASAFLFDLALLFVFIDVFRWNYLMNLYVNFRTAGRWR